MEGEPGFSSHCIELSCRDSVTVPGEAAGSALSVLSKAPSAVGGYAGRRWPISSVANALDGETLFPHGMVTEHDRLVLTEKCGQAQVRRACGARPVSRNTEIDYGFTKETTESEDQ